MTTYISKLNNDLSFGLESEINNFEKFKIFLNCPELQQTKKADIFDYESDEYLVELKSRKCLSTTYKDTMVGVNKLKYCKEEGKETYFCFQFQDGLFYWKYCSEDENKLRFGKGGRCDRQRYEIKDYFYIPTALLKKI
jgi:hypothetical protein